MLVGEFCFFNIIFADTIILKGSGKKIQGKIIERTNTDTLVSVIINNEKDLLILPNNEIEAIELDKAVVSLIPEKGTTYINNDIGLKIMGPPGWYMYTAEELTRAEKVTKEAAGELSKKVDLGASPWQTKVVEFTKYPFGKAFPNANISLSFVDIYEAPTDLKNPLRYLNYKLDKIKKVVKNFEFIEDPKKIILNGKEGARAVVRYILPVYDKPREFKQIVSISFSGNFAIEMLVTNTYENFDNDKGVIEDCLQSLEVSGTKVDAAESKLYKVVGGGFMFKPEEQKAVYTLFLKLKQEISDSYYAEIEYENPDDLSKPIFMFVKLTDLIKTFENKKGLVLESPNLERLKPFKAYNITVKTYEDRNKDNLIDTLNQKIISFLNY